MHQLDYFFDMMQKAGFKLPEERVYHFYYRKEDLRFAGELLQKNGIEKGARYLCFHLGANWEPKRWPAAHFAALAE